MIFLSNSRRLAVLLLLLFSLFCASPKKQIGEADLKLVMEYLTEARLGDRLNFAAEQKVRTDREILSNACERYKLDQDAVLAKIKEKYPQIYSELVGKNEK